MDLNLLAGLLKVSIETFKEERGDLYHRLIKQSNKLEKEWQDEMALPDNQRSDLAINNFMLEYGQLAKLIVAEATNK